MHILWQGMNFRDRVGSDTDDIQDSVKRTAVGIWNCRACNKTVAGGAWTVATTAAATVRRYLSMQRIFVCAQLKLTLAVLSVGCAN